MYKLKIITKKEFVKAVEETFFIASIIDDDKTNHLASYRSVVSSKAFLSKEEAILDLRGRLADIVNLLDMSYNNLKRE